jgi:hypothetical protein
MNEVVNNFFVALPGICAILLVHFSVRKTNQKLTGGKLDFVLAIALSRG